MVARVHLKLHSSKGRLHKKHLTQQFPKQKITIDWESIRRKYVTVLLLFFLTLLETAYQARQIFVQIKHSHRSYEVGKLV